MLHSTDYRYFKDTMTYRDVNKYTYLNFLCQQRRLKVGLHHDLDLHLLSTDLAYQWNHTEWQTDVFRCTIPATSIQQRLMWIQDKKVKVKVKAFPYSIPSVGPVADPGVQAVSLQVTISHPPGRRLPLLSARPAVTSPATEHHRPLASTKLYCLVTEAHRCEQLAQGCYAALPLVGFEPATYWSQIQRSTQPVALLGINNYNHTNSNIYSANIRASWFILWMQNQWQVAANPQSKPTDMGCQSPCTLMQSTPTIVNYY